MANLRSGERGRKLRFALFKRQRGKCYWCKIKMTKSGNMNPLLTDVTVDHIKPRCLGGGNRWKNVVAACYECNQYRGLWENILNQSNDGQS